MKSIIERLLLKRVDERVSYSRPHIDRNTKNVQIRAYYDPSTGNMPSYSHCKEVATKKAQRYNPSLKCTSYQHNFKTDSKGRYYWEFYFCAD